MTFPKAPRVVFKKNPLESVICQLRFPPILRINTDVPADFQDAIRKEFPLYDDETGNVRLELPDEIKRQVPAEFIAQIAGGATHRNHAFMSRNRDWKVNLASNFLALTSSNYLRWEGFQDQLSKPLRSLIEIYEPDCFDRIGLRYIDLIKRSRLRLTGTEWRALLQPAITGVLSESRVSKSVNSFEAKYMLDLKEHNGKVKLSLRIVQDPESGEECFLIDSDFFAYEPLPVDQAAPTLNYFREQGSRLIQWCITPTLREAMEPEVI